MSNVMMITGASSGFGSALAKKALEAGHKVVATSRDPSKLEALVGAYGDNVAVVQLDIGKHDQIPDAVEKAKAAFGSIDVLVNNAGYGLLGGIDEVSEAQIAQSFDINFFGPVHLIRAVLPHMREAKAGVIINMSAVAGFSNHVGFSIYGAAKAAIEGMSEALQQDVKHLGIRVHVIEPGPFRTSFIPESIEMVGGEGDDANSVGAFGKLISGMAGKQPGDPDKAAAVILNVVGDDAAPFRLPLGAYAHKEVQAKLKKVAAETEAWKEQTINTSFSS